MMRKTILIIGLLLVAALLVAGCGPRTKTMPINEQPAAPAKETEVAVEQDLPKAPEGASPEPEMPVEEPIEEPGDETSADPATPPTDLAQESPVSESELESLRAEIEGMEFEDLGGLSEE